MQSFGKYEVVEKIGVGGFGEVFRAFDPVLKRDLAIKTCTAEDEEIRKRFYREAEISGNLHHPYITTVYDFGVQDGVPYLVQEFLTGEDLDRVIRRREDLSYARKLDFLRQIARGLDHAQSKGVIHRDIKPGNIRVLADGSVKIMDFGIAKLLNQDSGLTRTGTTLGTTAYLSPEQIRGETVDLRTDIFSFGVLAYELLTYQRPFKGETISAVLYQVLNEQPEPMAAHWPDCPPETSALVARCMEKEPAKRFDDCGELVRRLERLSRQAARLPAEDAPAPAPAAPGGRRPAGAADEDLVSRAGSGEALVDFDLAPPPRPERYEAAERGGGRAGPRLWAAVALAAAVLGGAAWWMSTRPDAPPAGAQQTGLAAPSLEEAPNGSAPAGPGAGEPGGRGAAEEPEAPEAPEAPDPAAPGPEEARPEPAPPPPPPPATLVVPRSWSDQMTVSLNGGSRLALDRQRSWELAAGSHRLDFELDSLDYDAAETVTVDLDQGEARRVQSPIPPPARLTVQAHMGSPPGEVRLDDRSLGPSPIQGLVLAPGSHRLEIVSASAAGQPPVVRDLVLEAGRDTVVTFDLTGRKELLVVERGREGA